MINPYCDLVYWVWLHELLGIPLSIKRMLLAKIGTPEEIFKSNEDSIVDLLSCTSAVRKKIHAVWSCRTLKTAQTILTLNKQHNVNIICAQDANYEHIAIQDTQTPLVLYYLGTLAAPDNPVIGIIGTRSCTSYGKLVTTIAVEEAVQAHNIVASGLSFGIDAIAHETTLEQNGITYAFIPCGLQRAQPAAHASLMKRIAHSGAVITPYAIGKEALPFRFIGRNQLLASWCNPLLVVEAHITSGSMNTARIALSKGKRVLSVPNSLLEPKSSGTNSLLTEGAQAYIHTRLLEMSNTVMEKLSPLEEQIMKKIQTKATTTSEILSSLQEDSSTVLECLTTMELSHAIEYRSDGLWHCVGRE